MSAPQRGLLDTSAFIAGESGRELAELPEQKLGVINAEEDDYEQMARAHPALRVYRV